jgi:Ca2+/H+ antiporter, TMEM165/GDT1 family
LEAEFVVHFHVSVPPDVSMLVVAFSTILFAELVGDKSLYTIAALGLRFRAFPVLVGLTLAFAGKMFAAVLFAKIVNRVPNEWTNALSAFGFFACAFFIWFKDPQSTAINHAQDHGWFRALAISFGCLFFTEWCDTGQLAAAALAIHTQALFAVWLGGTLALLTKGALALTMGARLSASVPGKLIRSVATASYLVLGLLSLSQLLVR